MQKKPRLFATRRQNLTKFLLRMKLVIVFTLIASLQLSAKTYSQQRITLKLESAELKAALKQIEKKSIYRFLYNNDVLNSSQKVSIDANDELVTAVLDNVFNTSLLTYRILENNLVVITQKNVVPPSQDIKVTGRITGPTGEGVPGVTVKIKGSSVATSTDANGNYSISVPDGAKLVFSSVGFATQEVAVNGRTAINVVLEIAAKDINEVVVIGYGTANKRDLTGSIVKIAGKEVADKPNTNPIASLQGKVAGLSVVNNGVPGDNPDIRIRGTISMGSVSPLYVVDGIFTDNIDYLNTNDIESIEILKDPSSLAIFGVKGASGVIAISTKKAKAGQVNITLSSSYGSKKLVDKIALASGDDFRKIFAIEAANGLQDNDPTIGQKNTDFINNELSKWTGNTDWIDATTRTAAFHNTNLSIGAATDKNKFTMGLGFNNDQGLVKHVEYKKYTLSFNDEYKLNKFIKVGFNFVGSSEKLPNGGGGQYNPSNNLTDARKALPIIPSGTKTFKLNNPYLSPFDSAMYNLYSATPGIQNTERNPLLVLENNNGKFINNRLRGVGSVFAEISFLKDFTFRATFYKDLSFGDNRVYTPVYYAYNPAASNPANQAFLYNSLSSVFAKTYSQKSNQQDYILNYKKVLGDHSIALTAGNTWYEAGYSENTSLSKQKTGDQPIPDNKRFWYATNGFATPSSPTSDQWDYGTVSFLGRVLYNYKQKYFFTGSYRKDYASNINEGLKKQGQDFWAIGLGWELTKEKFMDQQRIFDFLKLKGSIGVLGNFNTGTVPGGKANYYPFYPGVTATQTTFGVNVVSVFQNSYLNSPDLHWETVNAKEVGIEFGALGNRLHGEINYYDKQTNDLLTFVRSGAGVLPTLRNAGQISNKGLELSAAWNQRLTNKLSLTVSGNLTTYKNTIVSLDEPVGNNPQFPSRTEVGQPIGYFWGYVVEGLYQSYSDILKSPVCNVSGGPARPGDFKYKDVNNDGVVDDKDKTIIGNPTPDFTYGGSITLKYKDFDLGIDIAGVYGNEVYRYWATSEQKNSVYNYPKYFLEGWNGPGTSNWVPIVDAQHLINRAPSSFGIEDGSYIRIRNLGLGYSFNLAKAKIKAARLYLNIQNLKTWKRNLGYSPEYTGDALNFGVDTGGAGGALPRIITAGFNVTF
jgi:TonB-linked SusC/RagA family outer membrane protein